MPVALKQVLTSLMKAPGSSEPWVAGRVLCRRPARLLCASSDAGRAEGVGEVVKEADFKLMVSDGYRS